MVLTTTAAVVAVMPNSALVVAKRVFVKVLLSAASAYSVALTVNRDSGDQELLEAYRQVVKKVHPDKGGSKEKFQVLRQSSRTKALRPGPSLLRTHDL